MASQLPFFSIIVPTFARRQQLSNCLAGFVHLDYPRDCFEVIVVDDGDAAPPSGIIAEVAGLLDIRLVCQPHSGPASARNMGASQARGTFLAFTDDDCQPAPDWLAVLAARLQQNPDCACGGNTINALPANPFSTASQLLIGYLYGYYNVDREHARFLASNNFAMSKAGFSSIGGFDTTYPYAAAEDRELCDRWLQLGRRMVYAPEAIVYHAHVLDLRSFWRQHWNYGRGAYFFRRVRALRGGTRIRIEPPLFYLNLLRSPFLQTNRMSALWLAILLGLSQVANAAGLLSEQAFRPVQSKVHG
ncbi:MAG TPA: glycosyltransferase [Anaerolineae bacterium]